jgi:hypothetical protein
MTKETPDGPGVVNYHTAWIPEEFSKIGKYLKIKDEFGEWDNGWKVVGVGSRKEEQFVLEDSQDYKRQRKASDI